MFQLLDKRNSERKLAFVFCRSFASTRSIDSENAIVLRSRIMEDARYLYRCAKEYVILELSQGGHFARDVPLTKEEERKYGQVAAYLIERSFIALGANHQVRGWILRGRDNDAPLLVHGYWEVIFLDFNFARACLFAYSELHPDLPAKIVIFEHEVSSPQSDYL